MSSADRIAAAPDTSVATLLSSLSLGIVVLDQAANVLHWNDWVAKRAGIAAAEACGRPLYALWPSLEGAGCRPASSRRCSWASPRCCPARSTATCCRCTPIPRGGRRACCG
ncbi:PAS domain-containing protein [Chitinimonas koreensis]|uniref:PAS domain-containing protein n=1 Tax=Chitinimonas koreensis TaxID=356302 RepID=UPI002240D973|nr:PAS domain-containing protein [Chitinimonas koreensis]